jgi:hypothetical protein
LSILLNTHYEEIFELIMSKPDKSVDERFWAKVEEPFDAINDCWVWKAARSQKGYGQFRIGPRGAGSNRNILAHVWAYEFFNGPVPKGNELHHICETKSCVNPSHLEPLTRAEHMRRSPNWRASMGARGRAKTHCRHGHPLSGNNLYLDGRGRRNCRECHKLNARRFRARAKAKRSAEL